jgi:hypothetical protein
MPGYSRCPGFRSVDDDPGTGGDLGRCWKPTASRSACAPPNSLAGRLASPQDAATLANPSRLSAAICFTPWSRHGARHSLSKALARS